jgi:hypothetical protein
MKLAQLAMAATLAMGILLGGCYGPKIDETTRDEKGRPVYLEDRVLESFNADLLALSLSIRRGDTTDEAGLRMKLGENARQYQVALLSALNDEDSVSRRLATSTSPGRCSPRSSTATRRKACA